LSSAAYGTILNSIEIRLVSHLYIATAGSCGCLRCVIYGGQGNRPAERPTGAGAPAGALLHRGRSNPPARGLGRHRRSTLPPRTGVGFRGAPGEERVQGGVRGAARRRRTAPDLDRPPRSEAE